jgi:ABC-2 type transport system permease protein
MYFLSPISYLAFAFVFLVTSYFFAGYFINTQVVDVRHIFSALVIITLFVTPFLTMRLIANELRHGTDELLFTSPASLIEIVLGKYLSTLVVSLMIIVISLIYPLILAMYGTIDISVLFLSYLAYFLYAATIMAVGLFASSLSSDLMTSGIAGLGMLLLLWVFDWVGSMFVDQQPLLEQFSIMGRMSELQTGLLDLADVIFYLTMIALFLFLTVQVLLRKRYQ